MAALEQQQLLLQQLIGQVQALYDAPPGSAQQRQADKWLTELVGLEGAWPVLLRVVSPAPGEGQTSAFDVRLTFIGAKIMQLKIQRDWRTCPPETRQTVQAMLVSHLQQQALGGAAAPHDAPIVQNQLVLAFVHVLLQTLVERHNAYQGQQQGQSTFVMELCRLFGITGAPDLGTQLKPLLMLLSILKGLPEEHNRRGGGGGGMDGLGSPSMQAPGGGPRGGGENGWGAGPLRIPEDDAHTVVNLVGSVLERCDAAEGSGLARNDEAAMAIARKAKLAALQCLQAWAMYVMQAPAWVTLGDMAAWGLLPALEGQVALAGTARALEPEAFCTVLAIITDGLRSLSEEQEHAEEEEEEEEGDGGGHYGPSVATATSSGDGGGGSWQGAGGAEERRRRRDEVLRSVARVLLGIGRYIVQPGNAYAGDEDVLRSACEGLLTFLERHLQPLWRRLSGGSSSQGGAPNSAVEEVVPMVRDLLQLLLAFTANPDDLGSVALPTLEHWVYLPEMLELSDHHHEHEPAHDLASAAARVLLEEVRPALVEVLARQCKGSPSWTAQEWRLGLGGGGGGRHQLLLHQQGGEEEEAWSRFADVLSFRSEAMDVGEALASTWPERHRVGELLYGVMAQQSGDPFAVEAVLWLLSGVARGLRKGAEEELEEEEEEGVGGYYGPAGENGGGGGGYYGPASSSAPSPPRRDEGLMQPQLWTAVIQGLASLQDPHPCFFLWHTACLLLHDLAAVFLARASPPILEAAAAFLLRALPHPVTCLVAAAALKQTCLQCCDPRSGRLGRGRERAASERLSGMLTEALQAAHASLKNGGGGEGQGGRLLLQHARAYADLTEALLLVVLSGSPEPSVEALAQIVTATIAAPSSNGSGSGGGGFPRRADRALVLCAALLALRRGSQGVQGGNNLLDAVVERALPAIDASLFGSLDAEAAVAARQRQERREQQQQQQQQAALHHQRQHSRPSHHGPLQQQPDELSAAVGACCDVLSTLLASVRAKGRFLPLLLGKALAFLECNAQALAAFQRESAPVSGTDPRRVAEEAGVVLWPGPVVFLNRVLRALWAEEEEEGGEGEAGHYGPMAGGGASGGNGNGGGVSKMAQGAGAWWGLFQQAVDAAVALTRAALELRVSEEDTTGGDPARRQLLVRFYEESFALLRTVAGLRTAEDDGDGGKGRLHPPSAVGADPYAARRGLELAVLALEIPLENSGSLRAVLALLDALLRQQGEAALLPLLQGLPPRLLPALLRTLVATVHLPSNVRRQIADLLHLLLCNGGQGGNGPLPQASALFQQALAALLAGGDGSAALHACFAHDPAALAFVGQGLERLANPAVSVTMRLEAVREFVRCFAGLGRGDLTLEEAQEGMASVGAGGALRRGY